MTTFVTRLSAPIQSWGLNRARYSTSPTNPVPTKTGVAGLLGACLGEPNHLSLLDQFRLLIRVDHTNAIDTDLQVGTPVKAHERPAYTRAHRLLYGSGKIAEDAYGPGAGGMASLATHDHIPWAEFTLAITPSDDLADRLTRALLHPVHMPYLGRQAYAPDFPFYLGHHTGSDGRALLTEVPTVQPYAAATVRDLPLKEATGGYTQPRTLDLGTIRTTVTPTRKEQIAWASQHLNR